MTMKISAIGIDLIKSFEGYLKPLPDGGCEAYQEPGDKPTIGWGCTRGIKLGMKWTREQAEAALLAELSIHEQRVNDIITVPLSQGQFDALVSFDYNTGGLTTQSGLSTLTQKLNAGDYDGASAEFARWNKMGGKVLNGLTARRAKEAAMFLDDARPMPQTVDPPKTYTAKDLQTTSSKFSLATWLQRLFGTAGVTTLGLVSSPDLGQSVSAISIAAKTFKEVGPWGLAIGFLVLVLLLEVFRAKTADDANSGRYTPSGETKTKAKEATP